MIPEIDFEGFGFFEAPNERGTPERNLLMAILERAILDYVGNDKKELECAREWLFEHGETAPYSEFSFPWLCHQLDLDPDKIGQMIWKMPKRGRKRVAPWYFDKQYAT